MSNRSITPMVSSSFFIIGQSTSRRSFLVLRQLIKSRSSLMRVPNCNDKAVPPTNVYGFMHSSFDSGSIRADVFGVIPFIILTDYTIEVARLQ